MVLKTTFKIDYYGDRMQKTWEIEIRCTGLHKNLDYYSRKKWTRSEKQEIMREIVKAEMKQIKRKT